MAYTVVEEVYGYALAKEDGTDLFVIFKTNENMIKPCASSLPEKEARDKFEELKERASFLKRST